MSQVSEITVFWNPETSGRVSAIQVQSRIKGTEAWGEVAAAADPAAGFHVFTSNAPGAEVELQARYRMVSGIYGPWDDFEIWTAEIKTPWTDIIGDTRPDDNADVTGEHTNAVDGIPAKDITGALKDGSGTFTPAREQIAAAKTIIDKMIADARKETADARAEIVTVRADLVPTIVAAQKAGDDASAKATTIGTDLTAEVARAKGVEGTLSSRIETAVGSADGAYTAIATERTQRVDGDTSLGQRIDSVTATANTDRANTSTKITDEATARASDIGAVGRRIDTVETDYKAADTNTNTRIGTEELASVTRDEALGRRTTSVESTLSGPTGIVARVGAEEISSVTRDEALGRRVTTTEAQINGSQDSALAAAIRNVDTARVADGVAYGGRIAAVEARSGGGGNLLTNTDFSTLVGWTKDYGTSLVESNAAGDTWQIGNVENNLSFHDVNPSPTVYSQVISDPFAVEAGTYVQFSALVAAHRARGWVSIFFYDSAGAAVAYGGENFGVRDMAGGAAIASHDIVGSKSFRVPDSAVRARMSLRIYPIMPSNNPYAWFHRPYVGLARQGQTEWNPYSPGSAKVSVNSALAAIRDESDTRASQTNALGIRTNTVEAQLRGEQDSAIAAAVRDEQLARVTKDDALGSRINTTEAKLNGSQDSALAAAVRDEALARTTKDDALGVRLNSVEARSGGGNLLSNTEWATGYTGWNNTGGPYVYARDGITGAEWWPVGMVPLVIGQENESQAGNGWWFADVKGLQAGTVYQLTAWVASHRCRAAIYIDFVDANGGFLGGGPAYSTRVNQNGTTRTIAEYERVVLNLTAPPSTSWARCYIGKEPTILGQGNSYAWLLRPQLTSVTSLNAPAVTYTAGNDSAVQIATSARITDEAITRANNDAALGTTISTVDANWRGANDVRYNEIVAANARISAEAVASSDRDSALGSRVDVVDANWRSSNDVRYNEIVNTNSRITNEAVASANRDGALGSRIDSVDARAGNIEASVSTTSTAIATLNGRTSAYWQTTAVAGNNRAQITVRADANGGAGVDFGGDVNFTGNLNVGADSGGNRVKITNQGVFVFDGNGTRRVALGLNF